MTVYGRMLEEDEEPYFYDPFEDEDNYAHEEEFCVNCGRPGVDGCNCCGGWLCGMCSETGCGFCEDCPTEEWIAEQRSKNGL